MSAGAGTGAAAQRQPDDAPQMCEVSPPVPHMEQQQQPHQEAVSTALFISSHISPFLESSQPRKQEEHFPFQQQLMQAFMAGMAAVVGNEREGMQSHATDPMLLGGDALPLGANHLDSQSVAPSVTMYNTCSGSYNPSAYPPHLAKTLYENGSGNGSGSSTAEAMALWAHQKSLMQALNGTDVMAAAHAVGTLTSGTSDIANLSQTSRQYGIEGCPFQVEICEKPALNVAHASPVRLSYQFI